MKTLILVLVFLLLVTIYARLAPVRPTAKHDIPQTADDIDTMAGFTAVRKITGDADDVLARLTRIILATPRTTPLSDAPLRFVTRSRVMAFPDIATVEIRGDSLFIHSHLTIGKSDVDVNKTRVLDWLEQLGPL